MGHVSETQLQVGKQLNEIKSEMLVNRLQHCPSIKPALVQLTLRGRCDMPPQTLTFLSFEVVLKSCLATATNNFKWVNIAHVTFVYFDTKHLQILMFKHICQSK